MIGGLIEKTPVLWAYFGSWKTGQAQAALFSACGLYRKTDEEGARGRKPAPGLDFFNQDDVSLVHEFDFPMHFDGDEVSVVIQKVRKPAVSGQIYYTLKDVVSFSCPNAKGYAHRKKETNWIFNIVSGEWF